MRFSITEFRFQVAYYYCCCCCFLSADKNLCFKSQLNDHYNRRFHFFILRMTYFCWLLLWPPLPLLNSRNKFCNCTNLRLQDQTEKTTKKSDGILRNGWIDEWVSEWKKKDRKCKEKGAARQKRIKKKRKTCNLLKRNDLFLLLPLPHLSGICMQWTKCRRQRRRRRWQLQTDILCLTITHSWFCLVIHPFSFFSSSCLGAEQCR